MNTTQQQFLNPFSPDLHKDKLYNNASGSPVKDSICQSLVMLESNAENVTKDFEERLKIDSTKDKSFFSPVKKNKYLSFENANVTITIPKNGKQKDVTCQRDVLCLLVSISYTTKKPVDIEKAMSHPLTPVPLSLCTADGTERKTAKSKLYDATMSELAVVPELAIFPEPLLPKSDLLQTYFFDLIAFYKKNKP